MKISKIKIKNFRSIKNSELDLDNFNIFVGKNNCGKTNFFEAIDFFFNGLSKLSGGINNLKYKQDHNLSLSVEIEFKGAQDGMRKMLNEKNKTSIQKALGTSDVVSIKKTDSEPRVLILNNIESNPGTGFDKALNDFLPKFEYIHTKLNYNSLTNYKKGTPIEVMLSEVIALILENNSKYIKFQEKFRELFEDEDSAIKKKFDSIGSNIKTHLEKQFAECNKVKFKVKAPIFEDLLKNFDTSIDDGVETSAEEKGDGMQRGLMLAIIQAYADFRKEQIDINKSFLFFIDEAELHLHPTAQRNLKDVLYNLSINGSDQVFVSTHSSVFVVDTYEDHKIFKVEKHDGETTINEINKSEKPYVVFDLLGGSPADLLLPKNFIVVEGQSEFELLTRVIARHYNDKPKIHIVIAHGDIDQAEKTVNAVEKVFSPLNTSIYKEKLVLLLDKPSQKKELGFKQFLNNYPNLSRENQVYILNEQAIEMCYPDQSCNIYTNWKKSHDTVMEMKSRKKKQLAKHVGANITKQQFELDLKICYDALLKAWENAY